MPRMTVTVTMAMVHASKDVALDSVVNFIEVLIVLCLVFYQLI
jgi:hypothetical protein